MINQWQQSDASSVGNNTWKQQIVESAGQQNVHLMEPGSFQQLKEDDMARMDDSVFNKHFFNNKILNVEDVQNIMQNGRWVIFYVAKLPFNLLNLSHCPSYLSLVLSSYHSIFSLIHKSSKHQKIKSPPSKTLLMPNFPF